MGTDNALDNLGTSTARYGCCPASKYMSSPEEDPFVEADSCSACPVGTFTSIPNDETSCQKCAIGKCSAVGSASCATCDSLPNYNGLQTGIRTGLGGLIDDLISKDAAKRTAVIAMYGPIENWDVSQITSMKYLFWARETFDEDISKWDTSGTTNMEGSKNSTNSFLN